MFEQLKEITKRPEPFSVYTADVLWTDEHIARQMLAFHLDPENDIASRSAEFIARATEWIANRFKLGFTSEVADFGCGPGLYTERLAARGIQVTGIDFSASSLAHARKSAEEKELKIDYVEANYLEFETDKKFDLITMIYCDLCPLSPRQRAKMFSKFNRLLKNDGHLLLDVFSIARFDTLKEDTSFGANLMNGFWAKGEYYGLLQNIKYEDIKLAIDKYTIVEPDRTRTVYNWLQHYSPESLATELNENGFEIEETLGDVAGGDYDEKAHSFAVIAKKK